MKRIVLFCILCMAAFVQQAAAQSCPPNLDFENGDFTNWDCFIGSTKGVSGQNVIELTASPPTAGRHEIISASSGNQLDRYGKFPMLCPYGGNYSVKLGNNNTGSGAEGLSYTFTVPTGVDTFTFTYFYAVVFEDPDHNPYEQPRFFVTAYEVATGQVINCASFDYISNGAIPGFEQSDVSGSVLFKNWSPASLQFAGLMGKTVRLEFKTADCTRGGHFGYAYLDVGSGCSNIMATAPYCVETNSLLLNAPYGFQTYTWYNENFTQIVGNQQSLTLSPPPVTSGTFYVDVIPYPGYGCRDTMKAVVNPLPVPDTPVAPSVVGYCQRATPQRLTATALPNHDLLWYTTASGGIPLTTAPLPSTAVAGTYYFYVSQKVLFGCESFRKKITVIITPTPVADFTVNTIRQCQNGNAYIFTSTSTNRSGAVFTWDFGDGNTRSAAGDSIINYTYVKAGNFNVKLTVVNEGVCPSTKNVNVTVIPKPVANFAVPLTVCEKQTPLVITNASNVPNNVATITQWWWNINGSIVQVKDPVTVTPQNPGALPIQLVVTTTEGCRSDTHAVVVPVRYRPVAAFSFGKLMCNNEPVLFTDASTLLPAAAPEKVVKWNWVFENGITSAQQHPTRYFTAGVFHAKLISETDFGCKSLVADSVFTIHAKPTIGLNINDSCVFRTINYQATDGLGTVNKWYWNFGSGLQRNQALITRSYSTEGDRSFTLLGETIHGCKDTIIRPFMIYDNDALAGRDTVAAWDEPVQLNANGGANVTYVWTPATGLSNAQIEKPIATLDHDQLYRLYAVTDKGCDSHSKIFIKRYKGPELYIPTAFTPNADGLNDILKVFPVGIKQFGFFAVFNRYGERIYYTTNMNNGWDGKYKGALLTSDTFVAYAEAIDYRGNKLVNKVTVTLMR